MITELALLDRATASLCALLCKHQTIISMAYQQKIQKLVSVVFRSLSYKANLISHEWASMFLFGLTVISIETGREWGQVIVWIIIAHLP